MKILKRAAATAAASLVLALVVDAPASAADGVTLTVHYTDSTSAPSGGATAQLLDGTAPDQQTVQRDAFGEVSTFAFSTAEDDATLGFRIPGDSAHPDELRYVQAIGGRAEVWLIDGDPRVYGEPRAVDETQATVRDEKVYVPHTALMDVLGVETPASPIATNGYVFDGHASGTVDVLTLYYGRDYHEIAVDLGRGITNSTTTMLDSYTDLDIAFYDVDGFRDGDIYNISFGAIERMLQVGTLVHPEGFFLLETQDAAHAEITEGDPAEVGFGPDAFADLDAFAQAQVDDGYSAIGISVVKDGKLVKNEAWGSALKYSTGLDDEGNVTAAALLPEEQRIAATADTMFDLASNTKMYATNYAVQRLVSEGRLDLDQRLVTFPGWEGFTDANSEYTGKWTKGGSGGIPADAPAGKETVTIRNLLNHVGGMIPDPEYPNLTAAGDLWYQSTDPDDRAGIIDAISRTPLRYAPGTTFAYSDVDYMILGLLVEQITGQRLDEYLADEFYGPLGLDGTAYRPLEAGFPADRIAATELNGNTRDGNVSFGIQEDGAPVPIREYTLRGEVHDEKAHYSLAGVGGHAGLFSTTGDMAVLTQLMLNGGVYDGREYFDRGVAQDFVTPFIGPGHTEAGSTVGLGWRLHSYRTGGYFYFNWGASRSTYGHQGWTGTLTVIDPVQRMSVTVLTTRIHSPIVNPPNGFANDALEASDLAPFVGLVYKGLERTDRDYRTEASVEAVEAITVPFGTTEEEVAALLPATLMITDRDGAVHETAVAWRTVPFDGSVAGEQRLVGELHRPAWLIAEEGAEPLVADALVVVTGTAPTITEQPADAEVAAGEDAVFSAAAEGAPAPTVQWQSSRDGIAWDDIEGADAVELTLFDVAEALSGTQYRAVFTNADGAVITDAARLTVTAGDGGRGGDDDPLPATGAEIPLWALAVAGMMMAVGAILLVVRRRRTQL